mmetsp:Transcript_2405/g.5362  ORF Transcript_2405/g.5362 Transcript_2405/m.5362 type:complete len:139 (-) Transcript_2405:69-485(-)|eukprot:CAMPEP_0204366802 /NCGR_PEP_ID=MMETSP0469-20131031/42947_1 /ASSEMBLY_ACC=CAM_ASM_000384 /TAXON_ID=2969 /ORGANISM="Oxyrrhis marina" /LENGTH=138 /DNA_ID=CAMNT_0051356075 /DNA_START=47 /DNA_END=463 /DNA_ORIENTATION=+
MLESDERAPLNSRNALKGLWQVQGTNSTARVQGDVILLSDGTSRQLQDVEGGLTAVTKGQSGRFRLSQQADDRVVWMGDAGSEEWLKLRRVSDPPDAFDAGWDDLLGPCLADSRGDSTDIVIAGAGDGRSPECTCCAQ